MDQSMPEKPEPSIDQGPLKRNLYGRWEIRDEITGNLLHEISSGDVIFLDVAGEWKLTRIEHSMSEGGYYSIDGYRLANGIHAALPTA